MSKGSAIIGMLVSLAVGYFLGGYMNNGGGGGLAVVPAAALPDPSVERYKVPVGNSPAKGGDRAMVTIVEVSDFQCPFCSRVEPTIDQILKTYGKKVRVVWKNNPLPFHQNAIPAAQTAREAKAQGKFWPKHEKLWAVVPEKKPPQPQPAQQDPNAVYKVPVGTSPMKGTKTAKVTIIEFSDFQCPFCSRVEPTLTEIEKDYGKDVRVIWKNNPL